MKHHLCLWATLVLAACTGRASAQEEEHIAQAFERLGAIVKRDDTKPNKPVIGLRFGLRNPIPDTTPEIIKDSLLDNVGFHLRHPDFGRVAPNGPQKSAAKPLDPNTPAVIKVTDQDLSDVSELENLETLDLSFGEITNQAVEHIKGLKKLQTLDLRNTQVNDAGLAMLQELPNLKHLYLTNCPITDDGLVHLQKLNLESLYVGGLETQVTDKGMRHLKELKSLQSLHLQHALGVTHDGLKELKELTGLRELSLHNTGIKGKGLEYLSGLKELRTLDLDLCYLTDDSLKHLAELKRLEVLNLDSNQLTDEGIKTLQELENLRQLSLYSTKVTDKGLKQLKGLKKLELLDLAGTSVTDAGKKEIKEALPKLEIGRFCQFPDWWHTYMEQRRQEDALNQQLAFPRLTMDYPRFHAESEKPAGTRVNSSPAGDIVATGLVIGGLLLGCFTLIFMLVRLWKTEEGDPCSKLFAVVGQLLICIVIGAVALLIVVPLVLGQKILEYYLFGH